LQVGSDRLSLPKTEEVIQFVGKFRWSENYLRGLVS
jgi:hypothetical protein